MADQMYNLVNNNKVDVGPVNGPILAAKAKTGIGLNEDEAKLISLTENYSNQMLHALRGAQVGPKEQEMFNKSLPRIGQPKKLFLENIRITKENLQKLNQRMAKMRPTPEIKTQKLGGQPDYIYDPSTGQFVRAK